MDKKRKTAKILGWVLAFAIALGLSILGTALVKPQLGQALAPGLFYSMICLIAVLKIADLVQLILQRRSEGRHTSHQTQKRRLGRLKQLRDGGAAAVGQLERKLNLICLLNDGLTALLTLMGLTACLLLYVQPGFAIFPIFLLQSSIFRLLQSGEKIDESNFPDPDRIPAQYALARKAQQAVGDAHKLRIVYSVGADASISLVRDTAYLSLGAELLACFHQEEIYQIMLHEFAHLQTKKQLRYARRSQRRQEERRFCGLLDQAEEDTFTLYRFFSSHIQEAAADRAVQVHGDAQTAANGLAKLAYSSYYLGGFLRTGENSNIYRQEEPPRDLVSARAGHFRLAVEKNRELAHRLLMHELKPRIGSHPIPRQRIEALGVTDVQVTFPQHEGVWGEEVRYALEKMDGQILEYISKDFEKVRAEYLADLKKVEDWRAAGEPMTHEDTRPVLNTLFAEGEYEEVIRISQAFQASGASEHEYCHALYLEGQARLKLLDDSGIQLLYRAAAINENYVREATDTIGAYCLTMGLEEEMDALRAYGEEMEDLNIERSSMFPILPSDTLEVVTREDAVFRENREVIRNAGQDVLEKVYLVKKTVSDQTYHYIYILYFKENTDEETQNRVYDAIFVHLDKQEESYALAVYEAAEKNWIEKHPEYLLTL